MTLAEVVLSTRAEHRGHAWMLTHLRDAARYRLTSEDLARINSYRGEAMELHELLPAILPRDRASWYECQVTGQHGTEMQLGYLAVPSVDAIEVGWVCYAHAYQRMSGPVGPARVTASEMTPPPACSEEAWRELRSASGIVLRAMLLGCGEVIG